MLIDYAKNFNQPLIGKNEKMKKWAIVLLIVTSTVRVTFHDLTVCNFYMSIMKLKAFFFLKLY